MALRSAPWRIPAESGYDRPMYVEPITPPSAPAGAHPVAAPIAAKPASDPASLVPLRAVVGSASVLWAGYFLLVTLRSLVVEDADYLAMLLPRLVVAISGVIITMLAWLVLRRFDRRALWQRVAVALVIMLPASVVLAVVNERAFAPIDAKLKAHENSLRALKVRVDRAGNLMVDIPDSPILTPQQMKAVRQRIDQVHMWQELTDVIIGRYFLLLAWAALYLALVNGEQARAAERREGDFRRAAKAAELRSLRYQVNPHFLFNTLNSLSALVMTGKVDAAETMIQTLSNFYRRTLVGDPTNDIMLADEIALQKLYLEIEAVRFPDRLRTRIAIPDALARVQVPGMMLQPLIENSVKYAVATSHDPVTITIEAREHDGLLEISVADDGPGAKAARGVGAVGCGIGLGNVRDRLAARFGDAASLETGPQQRGYRTVVRMPMVYARA